MQAHAKALQISCVAGYVAVGLAHQRLAEAARGGAVERANSCSKRWTWRRAARSK
jgi:hypothetical protein